MLKATATILSVLNKSTVQISSIPLGPIAKLNTNGGTFSCSYAAVEYLPQATAVPFWATLQNNNTMIGYANLPAFTASMAGNPVTLSYAQISLQGTPTPSFNPAVKTSINYAPVTASLSSILSVDGQQTVTIPAFTYTIKHSGHPTPYTCSAFTGSITIPSASIPYQEYLNSVGSSSIMQKSYVDIMY